MPKQRLQRHWNHDHCTGKRPRKSTPIWSILRKEIQTHPQLPRGMKRIRGPFVLVTVLTYVDRPFVQWHSLITTFYSFPFHICTYCFINFTYLSHSYAFFTSYFTFKYRPTRHIFLIPDVAVDRWIFIIVLGLIWTFKFSPTSTIKDTWSTQRRICILILGLKGLKKHLLDY